jgi:hypothetical protein
LAEAGLSLQGEGRLGGIGPRALPSAEVDADGGGAPSLPRFASSNNNRLRRTVGLKTSWSEPPSNKQDCFADPDVSGRYEDR